MDTYNYNNSVKVTLHDGLLKLHFMTFYLKKGEKASRKHIF